MSKRDVCCGVVPLVADRWSSRAMSGEPLEEMELKALFEAARWAPSSYNHQPWRFIYATRTMPEWETFLALLVPSNRDWARYGGVLIVIISHTMFEYNGNYSRTHSFDAGAAAENLALQGYSMGLVVHGMEGFDYGKARTELGIPESYTIEAMFVVGKKGDLSHLQKNLQEREYPSDRLSLEELIFKGKFGAADHK